MFTTKMRLAVISGWLRVERLTTIKRRGGSAETLVTAVAVMPCRWPSCAVVITATLDAIRRISERKRSASMPLTFRWWFMGSTSAML